MGQLIEHPMICDGKPVASVLSKKNANCPGSVKISAQLSIQVGGASGAGDIHIRNRLQIS
jgi:hypothetical protein